MDCVHMRVDVRRAGVDTSLGTDRGVDDGVNAVWGGEGVCEGDVALSEGWGCQMESGSSTCMRGDDELWGNISQSVGRVSLGWRMGVLQGYAEG